jgi:hypothetical protein
MRCTVTSAVTLRAYRYPARPRSERLAASGGSGAGRSNRVRSSDIGLPSSSRGTSASVHESQAVILAVASPSDRLANGF